MRSLLYAVGVFFIASATLQWPSAQVSAEEIVRLIRNYKTVPLTAEERREAEALARGTAGEAPLARMERLAHEYAYGDAQGDWADPKLAARMKADGFSLAETIRDPADGFAALVVKDERSGRYVLALRGTDDFGPSHVVFGTGDVWSDLGEVTTRVNVGITQFEKHSAWLKGVAESYGSQGKLDVTGHSLGGGLSNLFAAYFPDAVRRVVTFQAPAVSEAICDKYIQNVDKLPPAERPQFEATVAADDAVSLAGREYFPGTVVHAVYTSDRADTFLANHTAFLWQPTGVTKIDGTAYAPTDRLSAIADFSGKSFAPLRKEFVIDGLLNVATISDRSNRASQLIDTLVLQHALEEEMERLSSSTDTAAAVQRRINRLWEAAETTSTKLGGWRGLAVVADRLDRQAAAADDPEVKRLLIAEHDACRRASQSLKRREELALRAVGGERNTDLLKQVDSLNKLAADEHRTRRQALAERMEAQRKERQDQTEKLERRAKELAEKGLKPRDPNAPVDPNEGKPIIPVDCTIDVVLWPSDEGATREAASFTIRGGKVSGRFHNVFELPAINEPRFKREKAVYMRTFEGTVAPPNVISGKWVFEANPRSIRGWSVTGELAYHRIEKGMMTFDIDYRLHQDRTVSWSASAKSWMETIAVPLGPSVPDNPSEFSVSGVGVWQIRNP